MVKKKRKSCTTLTSSDRTILDHILRKEEENKKSWFNKKEIMRLRLKIQGGK